MQLFCLFFVSFFYNFSFLPILNPRHGQREVCLIRVSSETSSISYFAKHETKQVSCFAKQTCCFAKFALKRNNQFRMFRCFQTKRNSPFRMFRNNFYPIMSYINKIFFYSLKLHENRSRTLSRKPLQI
jgi:hypothetical protein